MNLNELVELAETTETKKTTGPPQLTDSTETVDRIVDDVLTGHTERFERIVALFQQPLFRYCYHMLGHVQEAEDAKQDVLVKAFERLNTYRKRISFSGWLYTIAYRYCVNVIRHKRMKHRLNQVFFRPQLDETTESGYGEVEMSLTLQDAMDELSPKERTVVILRLVEERSYEDVAAILNVTEANARKLCERAKRKLKDKLSREGVKTYEPYRPYVR